MDAYTRALVQRPTLRTPRFTLRTPTDADIPAIVAVAGDLHVARHLARMPHPYTPEHARFFLDHVVTTEITWAIAPNNTGAFIGAVGLARHADGTAELGYYVARERWGQGVATEAASVALAYGIGLLGASAIVSGHFADNPASGRVLAKLGFERVGTSDRPCLTTGETKASVEMRLV